VATRLFQITLEFLVSFAQGDNIWLRVEMYETAAMPVLLISERMKHFISEEKKRFNVFHLPFENGTTLYDFTGVVLCVTA